MMRRLQVLQLLVKQSRLHTLRSLSWSVRREGCTCQELLAVAGVASCGTRFFSSENKIPVDSTKQASPLSADAASKSGVSKAETATLSQQSASATSQPIQRIVKVLPTAKTKPKTDFSQSYTANIYLTSVRVFDDYLLGGSDLESLPKFKRRSPFPEYDDITVFSRRDVEKKAVEKWGSLENLLQQKQRMMNMDADERTAISAAKLARKEIRKQSAASSAKVYSEGSGRVVLYAVAINAINTLLKFSAWVYTGSHSMFSEFVHSLADTLNQIMLAIGVRQSLKEADSMHPYGWNRIRNVSSLISGVGIFCIGAGLSWYHGIIGLMHPTETDSMIWAIATLGGTLISEGASLMVAVNEILRRVKEQKTTFFEYVKQGQDPSTNVVLLEDFAAVLGVAIAGSCICISHYTGHTMADAIGSLLIGTLLGGVASVIIYSNSVALVGRSIPPKKKAELMTELENDRMIRALHDVKATDMGNFSVRFKAEVDFDGREITRSYLEKQDLETVLKDMQNAKNIEDAELFILKHGENIVDTLGAEVDRIEDSLRKRHPEIRHVDLEQL